MGGNAVARAENPGMARRWPLALLLCLCVGASPAPPPAPVTLRLAAVAPDGSAWARLLRQFAEDVQHSSGGNVHIK